MLCTRLHYPGIDVAGSYLDRKLAGDCTWPGCKRTPSDGAQMCEAHLKRTRAAQREEVRLRRKAKRRKKLCAFCPRRSDTYRCVVCKAKRAAARVRAKAHAQRSDSRSVDIAARTWKDAGNRARYHGQESRGRQSNAQLDEQDLDYAIEAIVKAKRALRVARAPEHAELPKADRIAAVRAALSQADHGVRFLETVLDRNRYSANMVEMVPDDNKRER